MPIQKLIALAFLSFFIQKGQFFAQKPSLPQNLSDGRSILRAQHERHAGKWWQTLTFEQATDFYKNGKIDTTEMWFEALQMPDKLRIDFGKIGSGNSALWRGDSLFTFKNGVQKNARRQPNELIFLLAGMYFEPFDSVAKKMEMLGFDLSKGEPNATWNGKKALRIGSGDDGANAIWLDEHRLLPQRIVQMKNGKKHEIRVDLRVPLIRGFSEAKLTFLIDSEIQQVERYNEIRTDPPLESAIFDPQKLFFFNWGR